MNFFEEVSWEDVYFGGSLLNYYDYIDFTSLLLVRKRLPNFVTSKLVV